MTAKHLTRTKAGKALLSLLVLAVLAVTLQTLVFSDAKFTTASSNASQRLGERHAHAHELHGRSGRGERGQPSPRTDRHR